MVPAGADIRWPGALLGVLVACLAGGTGAGCAEDPPARPNVVVVTLDTLRPDHLDFYGYERSTAPFLTEVAARSAVFLEAVSTSSWTAPATASLFTGLDPTAHGVTQGFFAHRRHARAVEREGRQEIRLNRLPDRLATLPERFADAGYTTFGIATNVNVGPEIGFARGFDHFRRLDPEPVSPAERARMVVPRRRASATAGEALSVLAAWQPLLERTGPWLLYVHLNDVHSPYRMREPWYRHSPLEPERRRSAYDSEIRYLDEALRQLATRLRIGPQTLLVVVSDHGEGFGEHGVLGHYRGLWRELNRVLMMVSAPGLGVEPQRRSERVGLVDVLPTVLDLAGLPPPEEAHGLSLAPLLRRGPGAEALARRLEDRALLAHRMKRDAETEEHTWAVLQGRWKLVQGREGTALFDLKTDPGEQRDRSAERPEVRARLEARLDALRRRGLPGGDREGHTATVEMDRETLENLRALGYVDEEAPARP